MPKEYYLYVNGQRVKVSEQISSFCIKNKKDANYF